MNHLGRFGTDARTIGRKQDQRHRALSRPANLLAFFMKPAHRAPLLPTVLWKARKASHKDVARAGLAKRALDAALPRQLVEAGRTTVW
jgi:hypothetical protein